MRSTAPAAIRASALLRGTPVLRARATTSTRTTSTPTIWRAPASPRCSAAGRSASYNASDDSELKMGDYFDLAADRFACRGRRAWPVDAAAAELSPRR